MNVQQFYDALVQSYDATVRFRLPSGELIPDHFHVTEVGRVDKNFIDCGGTRRHVASCLLQTWTATDLDHRLQASKLANILKLAAPILGSFDIPVEVEYGTSAAAHYIVSMSQTQASNITFELQGKQTDCLAKDKCGPNVIASMTNCCEEAYSELVRLEN